ncbi:hypothetical protein CRE_08297 [Caenorhabditis remanei]|uniref:Chitin-binding type-2 domain-containing protein n=1 Tax=Caenorhabditis remanei TaxID=31234 RepID=E3M3J5_CAERE|nr:hypothetical protein CRE_08297 [Caenorhabditis remanei]
MFLFYLFLFAVGLASAAKSKNVVCFEGERKPHEFHSRKYYKCVNNRWVQEECLFEYFFDQVSGFCVLINSPTMAPTPPKNSMGRICVPGSRHPIRFETTKYKECWWNGEGFNIRFCQEGAVFVQSQNMCMNVQTYPTTRWTTRPPPTTTEYYGSCTESGGRAGYKPDVYNCKNFYQCASGVWTQRSCGQGTVWNQSILTCDHNRGQCRPYTRPTISPTWPPYPPPTQTPYPYPGNQFKK